MINEFHELNSNLQAYLDDAKRIDDENVQLQEQINHLRSNYFQSIENHFKGLPNDFHNESHVLTRAHLQRYELKSRGKRFLAEREELKKRIHFLGNVEKEQIKRRQSLEKYQRKLQNDCRIIHEQMVNLSEYVQREKQIHQQSISHLDQLRIQLEQISIERSRCQFEIQSLREEVKLMQTTKEFLDEEYQSILSSQIEANEYFLSRLHETIERIREDFSQLNQQQFKQMEYEYEQWMNNLSIDQQQQQSTKPIEEYQINFDELIELKNQNEILSEKIFVLERDLSTIRNERRKELLEKENQFQRYNIELQQLYEHLQYLMEYDRNLKFELTLYRGVLQSEYRRKQRSNGVDVHPSTEDLVLDQDTLTDAPSLSAASPDVSEVILNDENVQEFETMSPTDVDQLPEKLIDSTFSTVYDGHNNNTSQEDATTLSEVDKNQYALVIQDLHYVYCSLLNNDGLIEITDDFPNHLIERLEFDDNLIQTLFDNLLKTYIVQPIQSENRLKTLDWEDFRDILFPILTGRYTEGHLRKIFDLFDINQTGYLSSKELTELLELIQVKNTNQLAEEMIQGKENLNIEEFLDMIKRIVDLKKNLLPSQIESQPWYIQHPLDGQTTDDQPLNNTHLSPSKTSNEIILLSRIFRRVGADFENRLLDSTKPSLPMQLTNEFIHNNIHISNDDLQNFIELYLDQKRKSDPLINWIEFRDIFLPFVNGGIISKDELTRWFDIIDFDQKKHLSTEQVLHLLRLLQMSNLDEVLSKMQEVLPMKDDFWTLEDLLFCLENLDQTSAHRLITNTQVNSYDLQWLRKHLF